MSFSVSSLQKCKVSDLYQIQAAINTSPKYQRQSDVWQLTRKQLFVDSIINNFDVPKLYFHDLDNADTGVRYAVVDGKQRLETLFKFLEDEFPLADDFSWINEAKSRPDISGRKFSELPIPVQSSFGNYRLPVQLIHTDDIGLIEELFTRLNEAATLSAPERRNGLGGPMVHAIRALAKHKFFTDSLPSENSRYKHLDLSAKFLYLTQLGEPADTKRKDLDNFVKDFRDRHDQAGAKSIAQKASAVLDRLHSIFKTSDNLLQSVGLVVVYFVMELTEETLSNRPKARSILALIDELRKQVRSLMRAKGDGADIPVQLSEFERVSQSPNDVGAMKTRIKILTAFLKKPSSIKTELDGLA